MTGKTFSGAVARAFLTAGVILAGQCSNAPAAMTNLSAQADTFINSGAPDNNAGAVAHVAAGTDGSGGNRRGLFRFDLSDVPSGATVTSAVFRLNVVVIPLFGAVNSTFELLRVNAGWNQGANSLGNNGGFAAFGEATWKSRIHSVATWTVAGGDFASASAASAVTGVGSYAWSGVGVVSDVQAWVNDPARNNGWILISRSEGTLRTARQFGAREGGAAAVLEIGYTPPAPLTPPQITSLALPGGDLTLRWTGQTNVKFDVEYRGGFDSNATWKIAEANLPAAASGANVWRQPPYLASPANPANPESFYRVKALPASPEPLGLKLGIVASNLVSPVVLTHARDGSGRMFVAEQTGAILTLSGGTLLAPPFLDLSNRMAALKPNNIGGIVAPGINPIYDERGLLGLAFHPGHATNGRFFVYYSSPTNAAGLDHESVLSEFKVSTTNANVADPASEVVLLRIGQPEFNHNGGALAFGPDGCLYVATGDGGGAGDAHPPIGNAQNLTNLLGKILRINVDSGAPYTVPADNPFVGVAGARPEIWAFGLRNPWRFAFDRGGSNQLWVADVGQNLWEEINLVRRGGNYGWRLLEANHAYDIPLAAALGISVPTLDFPLHEYRHGPLGISIIGGHVYRGGAWPELVGKYVFGDFSTSFGAADGAVYYLAETRPGCWERFAFPLSPGGGRLGRFVKGFGEDEAGEIYLLSSRNGGPSGNTADIRRLVKP